MEKKAKNQMLKISAKPPLVQQMPFKPKPATQRQKKRVQNSFKDRYS